jgi:uncharacterized protein with HEPN domain
MKRNIKIYIKDIIEYVDISAVWLVVKEEIPKLKPLLLKVLNDLEKEGGGWG